MSSLTDRTIKSPLPAGRGLFCVLGKVMSWTPVPVRRRFGRRGIGVGEIERQLGTPRPDELIEHTGRHDDGVEVAADAASQGAGAEGSQSDGHTGLGDQRQPQTAADRLGEPGSAAAQPGSGVLSDDASKEVENADGEQ